MVFFAEKPFLLWSSSESDEASAPIDFLDSDHAGTIIAIHQNQSVRFHDRLTGTTSAATEPLVDLSGAESLLSPAGGAAICLDEYSAQVHQVRARKSYRLPSSFAGSEGERMTAFCFSDDGSAVYIGTGMGSVWRHQVGTRSSDYLYGLPPVSTVRFGPHISFSNLDNEVRDSEVAIAEDVAATANEFSLTLNPTELRAIAAFLGKMAELQQEVRISALLSTAPAIISIAIAPNGQLVITTQEGTVLRVEVTDGMVSFKSLATVGRLLGAFASPTGRYLTVYEESGRLSMIDCTSGGVVLSPYEHDGQQHDFEDAFDSWDEDDEDYDDEAAWAEFESSDDEFDPDLPDEVFDDLIGPPVFGFYPDERLVAFGSCDGKIDLYDLTGEQPCHVIEFPGHTGAILEIFLLPLDDESTAVVTLGIDGTVKVWSTNGSPIQTHLGDLQGEITALSRVGAGNSFVFGSKTGEVYVSTIVEHIAEVN